MWTYSLEKRKALETRMALGLDFAKNEQRVLTYGNRES